MAQDDLMYMNWRELIKPQKVQKECAPNYGKFIAEPLERGFGLTLGNALRRIILSSLYGAAIVSIKIENVMHEFSVVPGVLEDVSELILNLKEVRLKMTAQGPRMLTLNVSGRGIVRAKDFVSPDGAVQVLNPDLHIATLSDEAKLVMTLKCNTGKGYAMAEENKDESDPVGTIPIDTVFSPIRRVNYVVGNARVGQRTDYDKLTLEIWTDGSLNPEYALAYASKILKDQVSMFINFDEEKEAVAEAEVPEDGEKPRFNENLYRSVDELELSVRSENCLLRGGVHTIGDLVSKSRSELMKIRNLGKISLREIEEKLEKFSITLPGEEAPEEPVKED